VGWMPRPQTATAPNRSCQPPFQPPLIHLTSSRVVSQTSPFGDDHASARWIGDGRVPNGTRSFSLTLDRCPDGTDRRGRGPRYFCTFFLYDEGSTATAPSSIRKGRVRRVVSVDCLLWVPSSSTRSGGTWVGQTERMGLTFTIAFRSMFADRSHDWTKSEKKLTAGTHFRSIVIRAVSRESLLLAGRSTRSK
jgi:hypothetical protein